MKEEPFIVDIRQNYIIVSAVIDEEADFHSMMRALTIAGQCRFMSADEAGKEAAPTPAPDGGRDG